MDNDMSNVRNVSYMFYNCSSLSGNVYLASDDAFLFGTAVSLKLTNLTNTRYMFYGCVGITDCFMMALNLQNISDMRYMFYNCTSMLSFRAGRTTFNSEYEYVDLIYSPFFNMFYGCHENILVQFETCTNTDHIIDYIKNNYPNFIIYG